MKIDLNEGYKGIFVRHIHLLLWTSNKHHLILAYKPPTWNINFFVGVLWILFLSISLVWWIDEYISQISTCKKLISVGQTWLYVVMTSISGTRYTWKIGVVSQVFCGRYQDICVSYNRMQVSVIVIVIATVK